MYPRLALNPRSPFSTSQVMLLQVVCHCTQKYTLLNIAFGSFFHHKVYGNRNAKLIRMYGQIWSCLVTNNRQTKLYKVSSLKCKLSFLNHFWSFIKFAMFISFQKWRIVESYPKHQLLQTILCLSFHWLAALPFCDTVYSVWPQVEGSETWFQFLPAAVTVVPRHTNTSTVKALVTFNHSAGLLSCGRSLCHGMCEHVCEVRGQAWASSPSRPSTNMCCICLPKPGLYNLTCFSVLSIFLQISSFSFWLDKIPACVCTAFSLPAHQLIHI